MFFFDLYGQNNAVFYVSVNSPDGGNGTFKKPFNNLVDAQKAVNSRKSKDYNIKVVLRRGIYELTKPLIFAPNDGGDSLYGVEYIAYRNERVTISGGKKLSGVWERTEKENVWKLKIHKFSKEKDIFRSLFLDHKRLQRATSDTLFSEGPIPEYAGLYKVWDFKAIKKLAKDSIDVFCGFAYERGTLDKLKNISSAEVIVYNSWEASWHKLWNIDRDKHILYFKNPLTYPVGFFHPRVRYRIENSLDYLDKPDEWVLDYNTGELLYYAPSKLNPNNLTFTIPVLESLITLNGNSEKKQFVTNIKFTNINFSYSSSAWGINKVELDHGSEIFRKFPHLDLKQGFSSVQASLDCGPAILLRWAKNCSFVNCSFEHLGNYAIWIASFSSDNAIVNCRFNDIGGGGIIIGFDIPGGKRTDFPEEKSPSYNKIINCQISNCGVIFPSGVGIGIMQANHCLIKENKIFNLPYTGISVGWTYNFEENYTNYNLIEDNHIYSVMRTLADGGGIYTLGKQTGSIYRGNYIENIYKSKNAIGSNNNGFFFDEGSSGFLVDKNVVLNIQNQDIRYNNTDSTKIKFGLNYFQKKGDNKDFLKVKNRK
ncbi:hypothetical protein GVN16_05850 [Emticicia sp. CRIBPO]|uniref:right-handed parallel beta-helix repeat-containing protein n=1 Tax=Emticicia sp. CRIBPO TaxID=2683258 RepID=UPI00141326E1|nr:right-handed parallel beta-helix repeat-containing protein [Emticicia sp. CRIBPO]NBA85274.1 hypothetical protein [Emticicia sp. CRIBPO]